MPAKMDDPLMNAYSFVAGGAAPADLRSAALLAFGLRQLAKDRKLEWTGTSKRDLMGFPDEARRAIGYAPTAQGC